EGRLRSKGGSIFIGLGVAYVIAGLFIRPLLYLAVAYFLVMFGLAHLGGRLWDKKVGKWLLFVGIVGFFVSFLDPNFYLIAAKPDNVPIGAMIFLLGIFTWIALRKAYLNDKQIAGGGIPWEKTESDEKLFTWPDLVYTEMLCMILLTVVMSVWSVALRAPLEEAANPTSSPNPAKANWYFFGPYEYWDPNKLVPLVNVDLSELVWVQWLGMPLPKIWPIREIFGIVLVVAYLSLPPILAAGPFRRFYLKMGPPRFYVGA